MILSEHPELGEGESWVNLASRIVEMAIRDITSDESDRRDEKLREEALNFIFSDWFEFLSAFLGIDVENFRQHITHYADENLSMPE